MEITEQVTHDSQFLDYNAWLFWDRATVEQRDAQLDRQRTILLRANGSIGERVFISPTAMVEPEELELGAKSYIAAHAYVTGTLKAGDNCTINAFTVVRGLVRLGNGVRIGAHTSILGFNHSMEPDRPVHQQPISSRGITVGNDVWIGSNAVLVDGVNVGAHAVIGAGSVVTKDVPDWAVVAGNPARVIRDRRTPKGDSEKPPALASRVAQFAEDARAQAQAILRRSWEPNAVAPDGSGAGRFVDAPGAPATLRAHADAIEIGILLTGCPPEQLSREEHIQRLRQNQDEASGLTPTLDGQGRHRPGPADPEDGDTLYHVLSLGYALDLLGSSFLHPIRTVADLTPPDVLDFLDRLPWQSQGWSAGARVDMLGTALLRNLRHPDGHAGAEAQAARRAADTVFGWLLTHADRDTGMWSRARMSDGLLQPVNGYYRASRGTFAQFGVPVPYPERVVDAVLRQAADQRHFGPGRTTACNLLDVAHPLWLVSRQTGHRGDEIRGLAREHLTAVIDQWVPHQGFPFRFPPLSGPREPGQVPGLQGTEMWLATLWYLADLAGISESLGYRPAGVHRPEPAFDLAAGERPS
jgi:carbonic anhydrase/acetyltransferase-like protein (isoleucine patch superfamily)